MSRNTVHYPSIRPDLLRLPILGRLLRWRYGRLVFQIPLLLIALVLMYDGFTGSSLAGQNLATVGAWVHYRGLVILALLLVGNLFCMGCPFTLPRTLAKRLSSRGRRFPRLLRNKWISISALFILFLLYEWLDLWASPLLTAWIILAYFIAAFVFEAIFTESPFCKYVCPIGAFNFTHSLVSPTQIGTHSADICRTCVGKECINGSYRTEPLILIDEISSDGQSIKSHTQGPAGTLGCGTLLFVPQITSNLDCTLCLDCARACPHQNVRWFVQFPGQSLIRDNILPKRWDVSLLLIGLTFMGLMNAFGMVSPVYDLMRNLAQELGLNQLGWSAPIIELMVLLIIFGIGCLLLPVVLTLMTARLTQILTATKSRSLRDTVAHFAPSFVPLSLGIWIAHYGFHFLVGMFTIVPVLQSFLIDHSIFWLGATPDWTLVGVDEVIVGVIQAIALISGFIGSSLLAERAARRGYGRKAPLAFISWALLFLAITYVAVQIFSLPMEMRGALSLN